MITAIPGRYAERSEPICLTTASDHVATDVLPGLFGQSPAYETMTRQIRKIAVTSAPVLIEGETGSGKEVAARAIHYLGERQDKPFIPLNCGAVPDSLFESELFGHARGAFTDAKQARRGLIAEACGGTLFLDEIDALSPRAQVAMLRFLQDQRYRPVGQDREWLADARIIAASNASLPARVAAGAFRGDLLYRLNILSLSIPPLRERRGDIALLAQHYLRSFSQQYGLSGKRLHPATLSWMQHYDWPGNVRELENLVHRLVLLSDDDEILYRGTTALDEQTPELPQKVPSSSPAGAACLAGHTDFQRAKAQVIAEFERAFLLQLLSKTNGNVTAAARLANKERRALGKLLKKHGIVARRYVGPDEGGGQST